MKKKIISESFKNISIRGRVAFFSSYLEHIIINNNRTLDDWEIILTEIWAFTSTNRLDDWHEKVAEYLPESILEDISFEKKETIYISIEDYTNLRLLYIGAEKEILYLIEQIFYIGTIELYGSAGEKGLQSLLIIKEVLEYIEFNTSSLPPLPDIGVYKKFKFSDEYGWGIAFLKEQIY